MPHPNGHERRGYGTNHRREAGGVFPINHNKHIGSAFEERERRWDEGGWNLVELQVTLMLIVFLAGLAYPAFVQWADRVERDLFLGVLAADIRMAQREAAAMEEEVTLTFQSEDGIYQIRRMGELIRQGQVPARFEVKSNYPQNRIRFRRTGQVRGGTLTIWSQDKQVGKVIIQVASGRPRVEAEP